MRAASDQLSRFTVARASRVTASMAGGTRGTRGEASDDRSDDVPCDDEVESGPDDETLLPVGGGWEGAEAAAPPDADS